MKRAVVLLLSVLTGATFTAAFATAAAAQSYPSRPVRILVGFAPGGTTDRMARIVVERLGGPPAARWRSPVSSRNRAIGRARRG